MIRATKPPRFTLLPLLSLSLASADAATTIDPGNTGEKYAYAANVGWLNMAADDTNGVEIGEYFCSGFAWAANIGWIHFGDGAPDNGMAYQNNSATDFGVNVESYSYSGGGHTADLRGYAYSANVGWIAFEPNGDPRLNLTTGELEGFAYGANIGWIALSGTHVTIDTNLLPAPDTDLDGIGDPFEFTHAGGLGTMSSETDSDGDGSKDVNEYLAGTDPLDANDIFRIVQIENTNTSGVFEIMFTTKPGRVYRIQTSPDLSSESWSNTGSLMHPAGSTHTGQVTEPGDGASHFWRAQVLNPLAPQP